MKKLNDWLNTASIWKQFVFAVIVMFVVCESVFRSCGLDISIYRELFGSFFISLLMSLFFISFSYLVNKSKAFWNKAEELEKKIAETNDKETLKLLFDNDFKELRKMSGGGPHVSKLNELYGILKTKYNFKTTIVEPTKEKSINTSSIREEKIKAIMLFDELHNHNINSEKWYGDWIDNNDIYDIAYKWWMKDLTYVEQKPFLDSVNYDRRISVRKDQIISFYRNRNNIKYIPE
jgi:hypothetical protein